MRAETGYTSLYLAAAVGKTHGADFRISEPEYAYLIPAKLLVMTAIAR
jgi:hypothetical protein